MKQRIKKFLNYLDNNIHPDRVEAIYHVIKELSIIFLLLFISILTGIVGFTLIEGYNLLDAFYMTIITISTVGYGEVQPLSNGGKLFSAFMIITNIGIFTYAVSSIATFIVDGNYRKILGDIVIGRKIDRMKNHIIVCGYGRYGKNVVEHFRNQNIPCILIESNLDKVSEIRRSDNIQVLEGDATDENILLEAGIQRARALISTLPVDADNVYVILTARQLSDTVKIISRANVAGSKKNMKRAGANHVLVPENIGGFYMSALVTKPDIINVFSEISSLQKQNFNMAEIIFNDLADHLKGKRIKELQLEERAGVKIIGYKSPDKQFIINPSMDTFIEDNGALLVLGNRDQIEVFHEMMSEYRFIV